LTKVLLRETMKGVIPEKVRSRKDKIGFATPEGQWFSTVGREYIKSIFSSRSFAERGYFNPSVICETFYRFCISSSSNISFYYFSQCWQAISPLRRALTDEVCC